MLHLTEEGFLNGEQVSWTPANRRLRFSPLLALMLLLLLGWMAAAQEISHSQGQSDQSILRALGADNVQIIRTGKSEASPVRRGFEHDRGTSKRLDLGLPPSTCIVLITRAVSDNFVMPAGISAACVKTAPYLARAPPSEGI